jgi:hypothetical protein
MISIIPATSVQDFDLKALADTVQNGLPSYAVPKFLRFKKEFETTGTHKIKKTLLREEGFNPNKVDESLYVLLPDNTEYEPLTKGLYNDILSGKYRF